MQEWMCNMTDLDALRRRYENHQAGLLGARHNYAVLCPLIEKSDELHLLFEVRAAALRQPGEVCFPGGRMEPGETPAMCALRETEEELSIPPEEIQLIGTPDFICNQRSFLLYPILGVVSAAGMAAMHPSPAEVAETFTVPLSFFRNTEPELYTYALRPEIPGDFPYETVGIPRSYPWAQGRVELPVWHWQSHVIWGMTARIVKDLSQP